VLPVLVVVLLALVIVVEPVVLPVLVVSPSPPHAEAKQAVAAVRTAT
jgi:hypothetical protein